MNLIDSLAWLMVRFVALIQAGIGEFLLLVFKPVPYKNMKEYEFLTNLYMSGLFIFQSNSPDDVPDSIRPMMINLGRLVLAVLVAGVAKDIFMVVRLAVK